MNAVDRPVSDPHEIQKTLELLTAVESDRQSTQRSLANSLGVALGITNALIRRCVTKGYLKVTQAPARRFAYYLTPQGMAEKSRLVADYVNASLDFFRLARGQFDALMTQATEAGHGRILLVGCGELAEIAVLSASTAGMIVAGVVDLYESGVRHFHGHTVAATTAGMDFDVVLVAETRDPQTVYHRLRQDFRADQLLVPALLRIATGDVTA